MRRAGNPRCAALRSSRAQLVGQAPSPISLMSHTPRPSDHQTDRGSSWALEPAILTSARPVVLMDTQDDRASVLLRAVRTNVFGWARRVRHSTCRLESMPTSDREPLDAQASKEPSRAGPLLVYGGAFPCSGFGRFGAVAHQAKNWAARRPIARRHHRGQPH